MPLSAEPVQSCGRKHVKNRNSLDQSNQVVIKRFHIPSLACSLADLGLVQILRPSGRRVVRASSKQECH
jgi:hypothetical protein